MIRTAFKKCEKTFLYLRSCCGGPGNVLKLGSCWHSGHWLYFSITIESGRVTYMVASRDTCIVWLVGIRQGSPIGTAGLSHFQSDIIENTIETKELLVKVQVIKFQMIKEFDRVTQLAASQRICADQLVEMWQGYSIGTAVWLHMT